MATLLGAIDSSAGTPAGYAAASSTRRASCCVLCVCAQQRGMFGCKYLCAASLQLHGQQQRGAEQIALQRVDQCWPCWVLLLMLAVVWPQQPLWRLTGCEACRATTCCHNNTNDSHQPHTCESAAVGFTPCTWAVSSTSRHRHGCWCTSTVSAKHSPELESHVAYDSWRCGSSSSSWLTRSSASSCWEAMTGATSSNGSSTRQRRDALAWRFGLFMTLAMRASAWGRLRRRG